MDQRSTGNNESLPGPPPAYDDIARITIEALQKIGHEAANGITQLERLLDRAKKPQPDFAARSTPAQPSTDAHLMEVIAAVHQRLGIDPSDPQTLSDTYALLRQTNSGAAQLRQRDGGSRRDAVGEYPTQPPTYAAAFFWGFHIVIPHEAMVYLDTAIGIGLIADAAALGAVMGKAIAAAVAAGAAASVPIAGWILAGVFLQLMATWAICHAVDKGNGIYLSMLWIAPGIFVPTTR